jgi:hypothetical protein
MASKRLRAKKCAPGQLRMYWGREDRFNGPDVILAHGGGTASKRDTTLLYLFMCAPRPTFDRKPEAIDQPLIKQLADRRYDLTTLEFSIKKLPTPPSGGAGQ